MSKPTENKARPAGTGRPEKAPRRRRREPPGLARLLLFFLDRFEAGIVLTGTEVKAARGGRVTLRDAWATITNGEMWLMNCHISPYTHGNYMNHETTRTQACCCTRGTICGVSRGKTRERGITMIPLRVYLKRGKLKAEIAVCTGKKEYDKRETIKRREADMEARQAVRSSKSQRL